MRSFAQDLHFALRMLLKSPGFSALAIVTLALGIGANTAIFGVVRTVLLQPLPYEQPDQLVRFRSQMSWPDMQDIAKQSRSFSSLGGYSKLDLDYTQHVPAERIKASAVTPSMLPMLGVQPELGRWFAAEEGTAGGEHLILLSDAFWKTHLGGDPQVRGKRLSFNGGSFTVIGVMPPSFQLPQDEAEAWTLLPLEFPGALPFRGAHIMRAFGRMQPGTTLQQARAELDAIAHRLAVAYPVEDTDIRFIPISLHDYEVKDFRTALLLLFAAVVLVLLIACVNVANLLLTRISGRQREIAVRVALGATRLRLVRQFLAESIVLGISGGALGVLLANWLTRLVRIAGAQAVPRLEQTSIDGRVLAFNFTLAMLTVILFGLLPAIFASREISDPLRSSMTSSGGVKRRKLRTALVAAEVGMAMVLLVSAGLVIRSFQRLLSVSPGFSADNVITADISLPMDQYRDIAKRTVFFHQVEERLKTLPGVTAVAGTTEIPFGDNYVAHNLIVGGRPPVAEGTEPEIYYRGITPDYFRTMEIPVIRGRAFTSADTATSQDVAIINQAMARSLFPGEDPLGKTIRWAREDKVRWITIVGVVGDVRGVSLAEADEPAVYVPYTQEKNWWRTWMTFAIRTTDAPALLNQPVRNAVASVDRNIAVAKVRTMDERMDFLNANRRFQLLLFGFFAFLALILAAVGIYGVVSHLVAQRTREFGIRVAVGAQRRDVLGLVLHDGAIQVAVGVSLGAVASLAISRFLSTLLFETRPADPITFSSVVLLLVAVAMLSTYAPVRRAMNVNPVNALREE